MRGTATTTGLLFLAATTLTPHPDIDPAAEAAEYAPPGTHITTHDVEAWQSLIGEQVALSSPPPSGAMFNTHLWRPANWIATSATVETDPALPPPPSKGDKSTLAASMYARWRLQHHVAEDIAAMRRDGVKLDAATTATLGKIEEHLAKIAGHPAPSSVTKEQLTAVVAAISQVGKSVEELGDEVGAILGDGVAE